MFPSRFVKSSGIPYDTLKYSDPIPWQQGRGRLTWLVEVLLKSGSELSKVDLEFKLKHYFDQQLYRLCDRRMISVQ